MTSTNPKPKYELHVRGLPDTTNDFQLAEEFGKVAPVLNVQIETNEEGEK